MAEKACHVVAFATRIGLIPVLDHMSGMSTAEKVELGLILIVGLVLWLSAASLPGHISNGSLLLGSSVLLLLQGLIRDLWLLSRRNRQAQSAQPQQATCMCVESTLGVTGVVAGLIILGSSIDSQLSVDGWVWSFLAVAVLAVGFAIKDFVFELRPFRIRREKDHMNVVFSWKSNG